MLKPVFLELLPSMGVHLLVTLLVVSGAWYCLARARPQWSIPLRLMLLLGALYSVYGSSNLLISIHQSRLLAAVDARSRDTGQAQAPAGASEQALQIKQSFLRAVDELATAPDRITPENVKKLFEQAAAAFPHGQADRALYMKSITDVYLCQQLFFEDALASYKSRKATRSGDREKCESADGGFFNRDKLIPPEIAKDNAVAITALAAHQALKDPSGKVIEVGEELIRTNLEAQIRRLDAVRKIFSLARAG